MEVTRFSIPDAVTSALLRIRRLSCCALTAAAAIRGTGTANASFPTATLATGSSTTIFSTPQGQAGGTANWRATRR